MRKHFFLSFFWIVKKTPIMNHPTDETRIIDPTSGNEEWIIGIDRRSVDNIANILSHTQRSISKMPSPYVIRQLMRLLKTSNNLDLLKKVIDDLLLAQTSNIMLRDYLIIIIDRGPDFNSIFDYFMDLKIVQDNIKQIVNDPGPSNRSPLMHATAKNNYHQVKILMAHGGNPFITLDHRESAFTIIFEYPDNKKIEDNGGEYLKIIRLFVKYINATLGTNIYYRDMQIRHVLTTCRNYPATMILVRYLMQFQQVTAIIGNRSPDFDLIKALIVDINTSSPLEHPELLFAAAEYGIFSAFLSWDDILNISNISIVDANGRNLMYYALKSRNPLLIRHLLSFQISLPKLTPEELADLTLMQDEIGYSELMSDSQFITELLRLDPHSLMHILPRDIFNLISDYLLSDKLSKELTIDDENQ
jgi:ankyrin repeat protein